MDVNVLGRVRQEVKGNIYTFRGGKQTPRKHIYIILTHKPHFYVVKLGFTWVNIIFIIFAQNIDCGYLLEPPRRGGSNEYPQSKF